MGFHRCQRWWARGFASCPYAPLVEHEDSEDDDEEDEDLEDKPLVEAERPVLVPVPDEVRIEQEELPELFEIPILLDRPEETKESQQELEELMEEQIEEAMQEAVAAEPMDELNLGWVIPALLPVTGPVIVPALAPVIEGAYNAYSATLSPVAIAETVAAAVLESVVSANPNPDPDPVIEAVLAAAVTGVGAAMIGAPPEDYFGTGGTGLVPVPVMDPVEFLEPFEVILYTIIVGAVVVTAPAVIGGVGGLFFNWAAELEGLFGGAQ